MAGGGGLVKGLGRTLKTFFSKPVTVEYPFVRPEIDERYRGSFALDASKCIACELCAKACPNEVIRMKVVKDEQNKRKLAEYRMENGLCLYCGLCSEACPTAALTMTPEFELACYTKEEAGLHFVPGKEPVKDPLRVSGDLATGQVTAPPREDAARSVEGEAVSGGDKVAETESHGGTGVREEGRF